MNNMMVESTEDFALFENEFEAFQLKQQEQLEALAEMFIYPRVDKVKLDPIMVCFPIEEAYWHLCKTEGIKEGALDGFAVRMFDHISWLRKYVEYIDYFLCQFKKYKSSINTNGGIILNNLLEKVLLVKSPHGSWSFPKGKLHDMETDEQCAIREVKEETNLDISNLVDKTEYIEVYLKNNKCKLFLVRHSERTPTEITCPWEIADIRWFMTRSLPWNHGDELCKDERFGIPSTKFRNIIPFMGKLNDWLKFEREKYKSLHSQELRLMSSLGLPVEFSG